MKKRRLVILLCLVTMVSACGANVNVGGEWRVLCQFGAAGVKGGLPQQVDLVCTIDQRQNTLTGDCRPFGGVEGAPLAGRSRGRSVEWQFDIAANPESRKQPLVFRSSVAGQGATSMDGTLAFGEVRGGFTAQKR